MADSAAVYAEVLVDIPQSVLGDKLFTYRVPEYLSREAFVGAQVVVPFGHQDMVGGYVVALQGHTSGNFVAKEIAEVLDKDPLFDSQYVDFLYWIADYYCASLASVVAASIPADFSPRLKRMVELSAPKFLEQATVTQLEGKDLGCQKVVQALRASARCVLALSVLRQRTKLSSGHFYRAISLLRQAGMIQIHTQGRKQITPKCVGSVIWTGKSATNPRHEIILGTLKRYGGQMSTADLIGVAGTTYATIRKMTEQGLIAMLQEEVLRDPLAHVGLPSADMCSPLPQLTADQATALSQLSRCLKATVTDTVPGQDAEPWLLYGVTGSGKTEIYLRLIQEALHLGRTALLLVPEISLTPQLGERLKARFHDKVAVWHSALTPGERYDTWRRLRAGSVKVLLGARSAVLAGIPGLGLVIIDEEHDSSYKQTSPSPRYHAKRVALERARRVGAMVVLGSATPDVGSYWAACQLKQILELPTRVFQNKLPEVQIVDMRQEFALGNRSIFSNLLSGYLDECLSQKQQAILLINRRGYANHVFCRACGYVVRCRNCSVSMVFHQPGLDKQPCECVSYLCCHHCGVREASTTSCPSCGSLTLKQYGLGTQRVEQEVRKMFTQARIVRLDSDVTKQRGALQEIFKQFAQGSADILIGTQMVSKGLDIPGVTVVGVLAADAAFNLPDYRSIERGFQLLTQVSGRAGRGDKAGCVVLQTYDTQMPVLQWAQSHDFKSFAGEELTVRQMLEYPPFSQLIRIVVSGAEVMAVQASCEQLAEELTHFLEDQLVPDALKILGPAPCLIERVRGKFRYHLLIKNLAQEKGRALVVSFFRGKHLSPGLALAIDVDALDLI